eukprot:217428_1
MELVRSWLNTIGNINNSESSRNIIKSDYLIQNLGKSKRICLVTMTMNEFIIKPQNNEDAIEKIYLNQIHKIDQNNDRDIILSAHNINKQIKMICRSAKDANEWISQLKAMCTCIDDEVEEKYNDNNDKEPGQIIYQLNHYTKGQMEYISNIFDEYKSGVFVFGDNDMDKNRKKEEARQHYGGQAKIMGEYDQTIAFGITTTFTNQPSLLEFIDIINKEFKQLKHFISIGRDIIIPGRDENDENIEHNIGTGIAQLATEYLQYIQVQINSLQEYANNDDSIKMEYYGYKPSDLDVSINEKEEKYEYDKQILEMENMRLKMKILEMEKEQLKKQILNTKENKDEKENEHDEELKSDISIVTKGSVSDDEKPERLNSINWKWKDDNGEWISHTNNIAQMLEKCLSRNSISFECNSISGKYVFHKLSKYFGFQVNKKTQKGYEVKRICKSYKKNENDFNIWEWCKTDNVDMWNGDNSNAVWVAYSEDICKKIDKLKLFDSFQFNLSDYTYSIKKLSTNQCVEINLSTKTERNIRKKPVLCIESDNI